jgi:hypothetical protein
VVAVQLIGEVRASAGVHETARFRHDSIGSVVVGAAVAAVD